jgi:hypothetical protein
MNREFNVAGSTPAKHGERLVGPLSMTDEEKDITEFGAYLTALSPEALWDVLSHLDPDRYPRRREAVLREMARRDLFFVVPYTRWELQVRAFLGVSVFLAALALVLKTVGAFTIEISPHERLPFFVDLAVGGPRAARMVFPLVQALAMMAGIATAAITVIAGFQLLRRRIRSDIAVMAAVSTLTIGLALLLL